MDIDESLPLPPQQRDGLRAIETEDLELLSTEALQARIERLGAEISRCEAAIARKASSRIAAEAFFRKG